MLDLNIQIGNEYSPLVYSSQLLQISDEVRQALEEKRPLVALESTIIAHGLPHPINLETALQMEKAVRAEGAVPATIAVLDGRAHVGLSEAHLEVVANSEMAKAGSREVALHLAAGSSAATTVSATISLAHRTGIGLMATGGIGGVHRGFQASGDVSSDLTELSVTPVTVVCSGAKSILDLPRTLEMLETLRIPVVGYRTDEFPAFYSRRSGLKLEWSAQQPSEIARMVQTRRRLGERAGLLVVNPVPAEDAVGAAEVEEATRKALKEAQRQGVTGKAVTPFLLAQLQSRDPRRYLRANRALAVSNARLAAAIASEPQASGLRAP